MKRTINMLLACAAAAGLLCGCIKETFPTNTVTAEQVAASSTALDGLVRAIPVQIASHTQLSTSLNSDFGIPAVLLYLNCMSGDMVITGDPSVIDNFKTWLSNLNMSKDNARTELSWTYYYMWIKLCNDVITVCKSAGEMTSEQKSAYGIALAFRAQFYLDLVRMFEPKECTDPNIRNYTIPDNIKGLGVVITTDESSIGDQNPRSPVEDVYEQIFADLTLAEEMLDGYVRTSKNMPDKSVVYGIFARAYLERGTAGDADAYAKAALYARKAIDSSNGYTPLTQSEWEDPINGFNTDTFAAWMWSVTFPAAQMDSSSLKNFVVYMSTEESWSTYGWKAGRGINKLLYDGINDTDFRKHSWLDPLKFDYYNYQSCRPDKETYFIETLNAYANIKFRPAGGVYSVKTGGISDVPLMRIEEMYLIEAEALGAANLNDGKAALKSFINTYRDPAYTCDQTTFEAFQEEVARQVRIEFWGEGIPFWYKKRLALGIHLANSNCTIDTYRWEIDGRAPWWNFVIPLGEEQTNVAIVGFNNPDPTDTISPVIE